MSLEDFERRRERMRTARRLYVLLPLSISIDELKDLAEAGCSWRTF